MSGKLKLEKRTTEPSTNIRSSLVISRTATTDIRSLWVGDNSVSGTPILIADSTFITTHVINVESIRLVTPPYVRLILYPHRFTKLIDINKCFTCKS